MNYVHIIGRLGKDPETRFTADGLKVTVLVVATNSRKAGKEETIWWRVTLWGERWDKMMTYLTKGKPVMVGGEMRKPELYSDKNGQQQLSSIEVTADYVKFVPYGKSDQADQADQATTQQSTLQSDTALGAAPIQSTPGQEQHGADEEPLPF